MYFFVDSFFCKWFTGDSENDLKINIFLAVGESDVDVELDADVVFKDPAKDDIIYKIEDQKISRTHLIFYIVT